MKPVEFIQISQNEVKFEYENLKLVLEEKNYGVYSMGRCISLYQLEGIKKTFIKGIGCTRSDNHGGENDKTFLLKGVVKLEECQQAALVYVKSLIK